MEKYYLLHKNVKVALLDVNKDFCYIGNIRKIYNQEHLPIGTKIKETVDRSKLNQWLRGRAIPDTRDGIKDTLETLGFSAPEQLSLQYFGLSLTDHYWLKPIDEEIRWEEVNFFEHDYPKNVGDLLFGKEVEHVNFTSPDNTTDGWLKKRWITVDGRHFLKKAGSGTFKQEVFNEVFAEKVCDTLNIHYVLYCAVHIGQEPLSICENFITKDTELVSAYQVMSIIKQTGNISNYEQCRRCCELLEIEGIEDFLNQMIVLDYLIANEDRHLNNFGFIRDVNTLKFLGVAPIYDSGTSMYHDVDTNRIGQESIKCKPFNSRHEEQLKWVKSFDFVDFEKLENVNTFFQDLTKNFPMFPIERAKRLDFAFQKRVQSLKKIIQKRNGREVQGNVELVLHEQYHGNNTNVSNNLNLENLRNEIRKAIRIDSFSDDEVYETAEKCNTPFEKSAEKDPFYSAANIARLKKSIAQMEKTGGTIHEINLDD